MAAGNVPIATFAPPEFHIPTVIRKDQAVAIVAASADAPPGHSRWRHKRLGGPDRVRAVRVMTTGGDVLLFPAYRLFGKESAVMDHIKGELWGGGAHPRP